MAKHVIESLVDDLDGGKADESVGFGLDGKSYEIDLTERHAQGLRDALAPFVAAGRRVTGSAAAQQRPGAGTGRSRSETAAIREWAVQAGFQVSSRGRIPSTVLDAYMRRDNDAPTASSAPPEPSHDEPGAEEKPKPSRRARNPKETAKGGDGSVAELFREAGA